MPEKEHLDINRADIEVRMVPKGRFELPRANAH